MKTSMLTVLAGLALSGCVHSGGTDRALSGTWRSERPEAIPAAGGDTNYLVRTFTFDRDRWTIDFTIFDDAETRTPLFSGRNAGRVILRDAAGAPVGATNAEFTFEERSLTPQVPAIASALTSARCNGASWTAGQSQSVIEQGCAAFRIFPRAQCDREYDLVRQAGGRLLLGARPADGNLCSADRRPQALGAPLVKVG